MEKLKELLRGLPENCTLELWEEGKNWHARMLKNKKPILLIISPDFESIPDKIREH